MTTIDGSSDGVFIISATPFDDAGEIDWLSCDRLIEFYLDAGVSGITILGMMGEAPKLSSQESADFVEYVLRRVDRRVPIIVGVSAPGFAAMSELSKVAMGAGAAGVMIAPPSSVAKGDRAVARYFAQASEAVGTETPWVLQDFPLASNVPLDAALVREIADHDPSCMILKHEDWPGMDKLSTLRSAEAGGRRRISILVGNGGLFLPHELVRGADGAMTGFAYPEMLVEVCGLHKAGEHEAMLDLFDAYLPLLRYEQQPGLGLSARKYVLFKRGLIKNPHLRSPAPVLSSQSAAEIDWLMSRLSRRVAERER